ncbi:phage tail tip lysozyme [Psychrobacter sp. FME13]|uniref:phage tail tip lysozyme n=1 Tax=Psychrobacter sp. FME13 TaxID=2487708 RepID=UPI001CE3EBCA|nr:phage tail tip lysozyme [Psychrobacter sp. FME13]
MTTLNYDANGFIVGINRMKDGIDNVHDDTQEIIQILKSQNQIGNTRMRELTRAVKSANYRSESQASASISRTRSSSLDRRPRIPSSASTDGTNNRNSNRSSSGSASRSTISRASSSAADRGSNSSGSSNRSTSSSNNSPDNARRERDANGRFISDGSNSKRGFGLPGGMGGLSNDVSGMDPMLDSIREAKELLSPIGRAGKLAGRGAKFSWSKFKSMKRREPLPNDETRHNRENEKLLDKIWKAIKKQGSGGSGGGLLGGLLGGGGRNRRGGRGRRGLLGRLGGLGGGLVRGLGRKLPYIGAAIGAGSLAMDWDGLNHKEKSAGVGGVAGGAGGALAGAAAGATIGSVVPVIGTAIGGIIGGGVGYWLGSGAGEALGAAASPYIEDWTNSITAYNLPKKMSDTWNNGVKPFFSKILKTAGDFGSWVKDLPAGIKDFFGFDGGGNGAPAGEALRAADYAIKNAANESLGKCAEYVNNAFQAQGLKASGHGVDVATNLRKGNEGKFEDVAYDENYQPQVGDVMSMPSSKKSKHNYGHAAIYTKDGWVSDYKQGEKYGNTAAPNSDYYEDIQSGRIKPTISRMINSEAVAAPRSSSTIAKSNQAMDFFMSKGWTKEQAAGLVANLQKESQFDHKASGDSGKAYGVAQWHPDRQANFKKKYGKNIKQATYAEQLDFVDYELTKGTEQAAGKRLRKATNAAQAGSVVSQYYERPKNVESEKRERAAIAAGIANSHSVNTSIANKAKPSSSATGFSLGGMTSASSLASTGSYKPANLPATPVLKIPAMPKIKERLDSGGSNKPVILQSSNDTINQNLSDRGLAHAVTGGFGQDRMWG